MGGGRVRASRRLRAIRRNVRFLLMLRVLPPKVARFQWRAWRLASRLGDDFGPVSATRPRKLATLLRVAKSRHYVVELGTAMGWTAVALALADPAREVASYDPFERGQIALYLDLVPQHVRERVAIIVAPSEGGPRIDRPVDLLYIDSSHQREGTIRELEAWAPVLREGSVIVFDDYSHPDFPGVREAIDQLGLDGEQRDGLFVHRWRG
jgi:hypothetical protein